MGARTAGPAAAPTTNGPTKQHPRWRHDGNASDGRRPGHVDPPDPDDGRGLCLLESESARLAGAIEGLQSTAVADGISGEADAPTVVANGELHVQTQRLEKLRSAIANARVVRPDGRAVVGSRITVTDADGLPETYDLVAPGQADARTGRISPESPLGAALLGRRVGDLVEVAAAAGTWQVTVVSVS